MKQENQLLNDKSLNVLIAEDNETNMLLVKCILENILPDAGIWTAEDGLKAIELFKSVRPDIIFMDVRMPEKNGYEATAEIRQLDTHRNTPIIALTAGSQGERERCLQAGMDDYLRKPIVQDSIEKVIHKWLPSSNTKKVDNHLNHPVRKEVDASEHYNKTELRNRLKNNEELVRAVIRESKTGMDKCLGELKEQLAEEDFFSLMQTAHKLKGMAMSSCFNLLAKLAFELEGLNSSQIKEINDKITAINLEIRHIKTMI